MEIKKRVTLLGNLKIKKNKIKNPSYVTRKFYFQMHHLLPTGLLKLPFGPKWVLKKFHSRDFKSAIFKYEF